MAAARFKRGDRVKLTAHAARVYSTHFIQRSTRVNWFTRVGTVRRSAKLHVYVLWDGRTSLDNLQHGLLELAVEKPAPQIEQFDLFEEA